MNLLALENDLFNQLDSLHLDLAVERRAESFDGYHVIHQNGAVLIRFSGASFDPPVQNMQGAVKQPCTLNWSLLLGFRNLRSHQGAYESLETIRSGLQGFACPSDKTISQIVMVNTEFLAEENGVWWYGMAIKQQTTAYETLEKNGGAE